MGNQGNVSIVPADVYGRWRRLTRGARVSIVIFAPYLDATVQQLFKCQRLPSPEDFVVVTDLITGGGNQVAQLKALKWLLQQGAIVKHLPRLHAKVLVADWSNIAAGSQNFTRYARGSREVTAFNASAMLDSEVWGTLAAWKDDAENCDIELIDALLGSTRHQAKAVDAAVAELSNATEIELAKWRARQDAFWTDSLTSHQVPTWRFPQSEAAVWVKLAGEDWSYDSLQSVVGLVDLTQWVNASGTQLRTLKRLHMYPMLLPDGKRLVFARLAKTRITFLRTSVGPRATLVGSKYVYVWLSFPEPGESGENVRLRFTEFSDGSGAEVRVRARFNTRTVELLGVESRNVAGLASGNEFVQELSGTFADIGSFEEVFVNQLRPFQYRELGIENKNIGSFLERWVHFTMDIVDYHGAVVLQLRHRRWADDAESLDTMLIPLCWRGSAILRVPEPRQAKETKC